MTDINERAEQLINQGVSRRRVDAILKSEYGRSIGHQVHARIFNQRIERLSQQKVPPAKEIKKFATRRQAHYSHFIDAHFLRTEALEFSKLKSMKYKELRLMVAERRALWRSFVVRSERRGLSQPEAKAEWKKTVTRWYIRHNYVTGKVTSSLDRKRDKTPVPSPWAWFDKAREKLPPEEQATSPRMHRGRKSQRKPTVEKALLSRDIIALQSKLKATVSPLERAKLTDEIRALQAKIRNARYEDKI